jgi:Tol biopolymer transport system component
MDYSPNADRSKVVLSINHPQGQVNLFLLNLATNGLEQLTTTNDAYNPVWHP